MSNLTGQVLGTYRLVKHLGTGGFGEVYLGTHIHLNREAAIKVLLKLDEPEKERFRQEAQIIARLIHPHIITLFDYDVAGETPFLVMMYAPQGTMRTRYHPGTRLPLAEVVKYLTQAANGLQFAHDQHVVHRDIKPANMLIGSSGQILLSDFGLAVMWSGTHAAHTQQVIGTHGYMAPEQFQGHPRPASDQYSLAITGYEWLSGSRPRADALLGLGMLQMAWPETEIPPLRRVVPHLPSQLDDVFQQALASDWQKRFPSVRVFAEELARAANSGSPSTYFAQSGPSAGPISPRASLSQTPGQREGWLATTSVSPTTLPPSSPETLLATVPDNSAQPTPFPQTLPAGFENSTSSLLAPPPPPPVTYPHPLEYAPPPPGVGVAQPISPRKFRPLVLPVTRARNARFTWTWALGYSALLLALGSGLFTYMITYRSTTVQPAWIITLIVIDVVLLILLATVLCGALLGKWRALLVSIISLGWPLPGAYLLNPAIFTSSGAPTSADWAGLLLYAVLPLSAFVVGWIYERRRRAQFGVSFLSMSIGIALLIIPPIIISSILNSAGAYSGSSFAADLLASWCLVVLVIFPLALLVAGLEALLHTIVSKTMRGARAGEANTPASMG